MDYSLDGYTRRCTNAELQNFLEDCMLKKEWKQYAYVVPLILEVLEERRAYLPEAILQDWEQYCLSHSKE